MYKIIVLGQWLSPGGVFLRMTVCPCISNRHIISLKTLLASKRQLTLIFLPPVVGTEDRTWWAGVSFTLSIIEINTGLICACVATLGPLWKLAYAQVKDWTGWTSPCNSKGESWPSFVRKPPHSQSSEETRRPSGATVGGHGLPAGRAGRVVTYNGSTLTSNYEDEYGLLDASGWHPHGIREDRSYRSREDV